MKKFITVIIALAYFTVSTGFTVNLHYCMDKLYAAELGASTIDKCSKCGMEIETSNGCCKDDVKIIKLQQDQTPAQFVAVDFFLTPAQLPQSGFLNIEDYRGVILPEQKAHAPPLLNYQYTYLTNCVFRL